MVDTDDDDDDNDDDDDDDIYDDGDDDDDFDDDEIKKVIRTTEYTWQCVTCSTISSSSHNVIYQQPNPTACSTAGIDCLVSV